VSNIESSEQIPGRRSRARTLARVFSVVVIALVLVLALIYARLLIGPVPLNFLSDRAQGMVTSLIDDGFHVDWGDFGVALDGPFNPVVRLASVELLDAETDASIRMSALEIGISPLGLLYGQPEVRITLVEPHFQMVQDLFGPRFSRYALVEDADTGEITAQISEGNYIAPTVRIRQDGLQLAGQERNGTPGGLRSDNDWLIYNLEAMNQSLSEIAAQAMSGQLSRIVIRDGSVGILDTVYGLYKELDSLSVEVRAGRAEGRVSALFEAGIAGRVTHGTLIRSEVDGVARIEANVDEIDFATIIPFLDDPDGVVALRGAGALDLEVSFDAHTGVVERGVFRLDLTGTHLRLNNDAFEVTTSPFDLIWYPHEARYQFVEVDLAVGQSAAQVSGDLVLGFDRQFGPTVGMSIRAIDVNLHPDDMEAPEEPFEFVSFEGWSAPLYGAIGIDRLVAARDMASLVVNGRIDAVREGVGVDLRLSGRGASADDLKRLWPYLFSPEARDWFVDYVRDGKVHSADIHVNFPVGTIDMEGTGEPIPEGGLTIDIVGDDVQLQPFEGLPHFEIDGAARVSVRDNRLTLAFEHAVVLGPAGNIEITNAAFLNQNTAAAEQVLELSGDISGSVNAIVAMANGEPLNLLREIEVGYDINEIASQVEGNVTTTVIATLIMDEAGEIVNADYALNGSVSGARSRNPIEGYSFEDVRLAFTASQEGFEVNGSGQVENVPIDVQASQTRGNAPDIRVAATLSAADAAAFGIDVSEYMTGQVRVIASPREDGRFGFSANLTDATLALTDIGVSKARGVAGALNGIVGFEDGDVAISEIDMGFGDVRLRGDLALGLDGVLKSADFSTFRISPGDDAQVAMTPVDGGFALSVRGRQLDVKPMLRRFFDLNGTDGAGASQDLQNQRFDVSVQLQRAIGYYGTVAIDLGLELSVRGDEIRNVSLTTQLGGDSRASATTNVVPGGRVMTYASNDIGALLRFTGIYPRLVGGEGTLVIQQDTAAQAEAGVFVIRNFAIVDEANVAQIVGAHSESRQLIARGNSLNFDYGRAQFIRRADRIEVTEAMINGDSVGGTLRGNILTGQGRYDLAGTYVPLFGLNNIFQQIPLFGPIFGGRQGEGLIGVTFAIRGPLNEPDILINPASILAPGMFRSLFEYRAARQDG